MALKKKSKVTPIISKADVLKMAEDYNNISKQIKMLESKKKELSDKLKQGAESYGVQDDKGSYYLEDSSFIIGKVAKRSVKVDKDKAVSFFKSKGLKNCFKRVVSYEVNDSEVEKAFDEGSLTKKDLDTFTSISVSYSVSVSEKSEMPEVEVSTAARKRK